MRQPLDTGRMPRRAEPAGIPESIDRAVAVFGSRIKVAALLALQERPATGAELAVRLNVSRVLVRNHLIELEQLGILTVQPPRTEVDVRRRYFHLNRDALAAAVEALTAFATAPSEGTGSGKK